MTSQQYLKTKRRLTVDLRSEGAKLTFALKKHDDEMAKTARNQITHLKKQLKELEK